MRKEGVNTQKLAAAVREKRQEMGLSQQKLGAKAGLTAGSISWLEKGNVGNVSEGNIRKILSALGLELSGFMRGDGKSSAPATAPKTAEASGKKSGVKKKGQRVSHEAPKEKWSVSASVPGEMYRKVQDYMAARGLLMGDVVRLAMEKFLAEPGQSKAESTWADIPMNVLADLQAKLTGEGKKGPPARRDEEAGEVREILAELMEEEEDSVSTEEVKMLLKGGHGFTEIGELMGVPPEKVRAALLGERKAQRQKKRKELVETELKNLDRLQAALWDKATKGGSTPVELVLKIMDMRAKYMGVNGE
jgi:transcriptional regulator with XRE-family HTH domain